MVARVESGRADDRVRPRHSLLQIDRPLWVVVLAGHRAGSESLMGAYFFVRVTFIAVGSSPISASWPVKTPFSSVPS